MFVGWFHHFLLVFNLVHNFWLLVNESSFFFKILADVSLICVDASVFTKRFFVQSIFAFDLFERRIGTTTTRTAHESEIFTTAHFLFPARFSES